MTTLTPLEMLTEIKGKLAQIEHAMQDARDAVALAKAELDAERVKNAVLREALETILESENGSTLLDGGSILGAGLAGLAREALAGTERNANAL